MDIKAGVTVSDLLFGEIAMSVTCLMCLETQAYHNRAGL